MKHFLIATDFSAAANHAAEFMADFAQAVEGTLSLVCVVSLPVTVSEVPMPEEVFGELIEETKKTLEQMKEQLTRRTGGKVPITIHVPVGNTEQQILDLARSIQPEAIVLGIRKDHTLGRFLLGSSTSYFLKHSSFPLLLVPETASFGGLTHWALACDLTDSDRLPYAQLRKWFDASSVRRLDILHVSGEGESMVDTAQSGTLLNHLRDYHPTFHYLSGENIAIELDRYSQSNQVEVLALPTRHHGIKDLFLTKHAFRIVFAQKVPILAIPES